MATSQGLQAKISVANISEDSPTFAEVSKNSPGKSTISSPLRSNFQNMEDSWELVAVPAEIQHSTAGKEASSDCPESPGEKNEGNNKFKVRH